jgi:transcriptional regulator with XRE-family HTH domain
LVASSFSVTFVVFLGLGMLKPHSRIKMARRHLKMSQTAFASALGVQRSAVSHWEAPLGKNPTLANLRKIAELTAVQFEWLATGRGVMALSQDVVFDSIAAVQGLLIDDAIEIRMIEALRAIPLESRMSLVEVTEQMAELRLRTRKRRAMHP